MYDRYLFDGDFEDMSAPRACEVADLKHCPFTGELIVPVEQIMDEDTKELGESFNTYYQTNEGKIK